jgi:hypothetical protein
MYKTPNEWAEFIKRMLNFYGVYLVDKYDNFIYNLADECSDIHDTQQAVHHCSEKIHELVTLYGNDYRKE